MLRRRLTGVFISDIKLIARMPLLFVAILFPLLIVILHFFACSYISALNNAEKAMQYYTVIAVSLISAIPFLYGIVFSFIHLHGKLYDDSERSVKQRGERSEIYLVRMVFSGLWAFIAVLPVIYITDAVTTEGWLRSIYVSILLATAGQFIFTFSTGSGESLMRWRTRSLISVLFLLPVPFGLILHHPWNYFAFFSPFYWINWAWIIPSQGESLIYGLISLLIITAGGYFHYKKYVKGAMDE
jgi:hypothetical protein